MTSTPHILTALEDLPTPPDLIDPAPEPPAARQVGVEVECFLEGGVTFTVRVTNRERIAYEMTAARHKEWPPMESGQHFAMTFVTWAAAKRAGLTAVTFDAWRDQLEDWELVKDVPADPTR